MNDTGHEKSSVNVHCVIIVASTVISERDILLDIFPGQVQ